MGLKLVRRKDSPSWWLRGTVRGISVYKSTFTSDKEIADTVRIVIERQLLDESIFGKPLTVTFNQATEAYLAAGGSARFLAPIQDSLGKRQIRTIKQIDVDNAARKLHPNAAATTLNRQVYTPFIAVWNHAVINDWADLKKWKRAPVRRQSVMIVRPHSSRPFLRLLR